jgi:hypothetical protein
VFAETLIETDPCRTSGGAARLEWIAAGAADWFRAVYQVDSTLASFDPVFAVKGIVANGVSSTTRTCIALSRSYSRASPRIGHHS